MTDHDHEPDRPRFLTLDDVARELATSRAQVYALVRRQDLPAVKMGGRGQWRVERDKLEQYIVELYSETRAWTDAHPFTGDVDDEEPQEPQEPGASPEP